MFLTVDSAGSMINRSMTSRQIFRVVMKFLGTSEQQKFIELKPFTNVIILNHFYFLVATSKMWTKGLVIQPTKKRTITKEVCEVFL